LSHYLRIDGMRVSTPITAGAKPAVIGALNCAISEDAEVDAKDFVQIAMPANDKYSNSEFTSGPSPATVCSAYKHISSSCKLIVEDFE